MNYHINLWLRVWLVTCVVTQGLLNGYMFMDGGPGGWGGKGYRPQFLPNFCKISLFCLKFWHFYPYNPLTFQLAPHFQIHSVVYDVKFELLSKCTVMCMVT